MPKPDPKRVDALYEKLTGRKPEVGRYIVEKHSLAQKIVYIEDACKAVLECIEAIENAPPDADFVDLQRQLILEFRFLNTLQAY